MNDRLKQFDTAMELWQMMEAADVTRDPVCLDMWQWANSPLGNGKHSTHFQQRLANMLIPLVLAKQIAGSSLDIPEVDSASAILVGYEINTNRPIVLDVRILNRHLLVVGNTGSGKTTLLSMLLCQAESRGLASVSFHDRKGEGRRLLNFYRDGIIVLRPDQEPLNMLQPVGHTVNYSLAWASEFGKTANLRPETWPELVEILNRIHRGMRSDDPYPSQRDLERILLRLADSERRPKLETAAYALSALNSSLGDMARVRRGPSLKNRYRIIVHEHLGLPPRIDGYLAAMRLVRAQMTCGASGNVGILKTLCVSDEATYEFGKELSQSAGSGYISPHKRAITQLRSAGIGILAGVQMLSQIDESLKANVATIVVLRCPHPSEAREAASMLGLAQERVPEIQNLPVGVGFVRSEGFSGPLKIRIPNFNLGQYPSDEQVEACLSDEMTWLCEHTVYSPDRSEDSTPLHYQEILGETAESVVEESVEVDDETRRRFFDVHRALLREIDVHPNASVTEHYRNLHWSAWRGNRVKSQLLELGLIRSERQVSVNGRPRELLTVTQKGRQILGEHRE